MPTRILRILLNNKIIFCIFVLGIVHIFGSGFGSNLAQANLSY